MLGLIVNPRKHFSSESLNRPTNGRMDRWRLVLEHKLANRQFEKERRVAPKPIDEVFPGISRTRATIQNAVATPFALANADPGELIILSTICAYSAPKSIVEFGTFDGLTALHFAINSPPSARVVTIDLHPDDPIRQTTTDDTFYSKGMRVGSQFEAAPEAGKIQQVFCNTLEFDQTPLAGKVDMIFIDAGHAYELVRSDSNKALEMIGPGGIVLWHDYHYAHEGVYRWLNELSDRLPLFQVPGTKLVCHVSPRIATSTGPTPGAR